MTSTSSQTTPLEPTLYSLLPPSLHTSIISHLSLLAIHAEPLHLVERIYTTTNPVLPGQTRNLRFRSVRAAGPMRDKGKGKEKEKEKDDGQWVHTLAYVSSRLQSAEYSEAAVRAVMSVEVQDMSSPQEIEEFVEALGFRHSHSFTLTGHLLHLPIPIPTSPPLTLRLSITRLSSSASATKEEFPPDEPYLVQLQPSRPVYAIAPTGDIGLQDTIGVMQSTAGRIDGLEWSTGQ
ncbi:Hypothetical Protein CGB_F5520W [Cryptococcus gattii WM276]|uniref:Mediator complex subunit 18 n=2 Tax=Cryptococcus gattii TaxID=37769 RepID=E6R8L7_CRYGW|nr:Hypothetical Protein CGB_F5520W [Cryptococcus gattii WM276]ADV23108.1 Hypothetical Protein CGB_F5520W [Cryptococcus gattii WM276]KIR82581.1 hypothetical protein I306_00416 [Cryptococcus gattii EJB2]KJE04259.1 hypothetical protein I311_02067 [Cryptococcus gattii NT-10]